MSLRPMNTSFSHYFSYYHTTTFHHISLVGFFIFIFILSHLLLILLYLFSTLSGDPPQFILDDGHIISIIYTTDIDPKTLSLRRSSHWREFMVL